MRSSQLHQNKPLENISIAYKVAGLIADALSPRIMVENESDSYYVWSKDNLRLPQTRRADGGESNRSQFGMSTASYAVNEEALHEVITDRQRRNADKGIDLDISVTEMLTGQILLRKEQDLATMLQTALAFAGVTSLTSTFAWSANTTLSNPIAVVSSATSAIIAASGMKPNVLAMNDQSFYVAKDHVSVMDRIKYTSPDSVTPALLARLFDIEQVVVGSGVFNSAAEGLTDTMARIWTDTCILAYVAKTPGLRTLSAFGTFTQNAGAGSPALVKKWREEKVGGDVVEVSTMYQHKVLASDCVHQIVNTNQ